MLFISNGDFLVRDAENHVRTQVRDLAEQEREDKRQEIVNIFDMRIQHYDFESIMGFGDFIENKHLNKSYSISKVEQDLVQWLEMVRRDLAMIDRHTVKSPEDRDELIVEYQNTQNISVAFDNMDRRKEQMKQASEQAKQRELQAKRDTRKQEEQEQQEALYTITVGERDLNLVKEFLKRNDIDNTVRKVK